MAHKMRRKRCVHDEIEKKRSEVFRSAAFLTVAHATNLEDFINCRARALEDGQDQAKNLFARI